jgi:hypothetical protein
MNYLLIQNPGVAPVEGYTLLGMSTTRDCGAEGTIGQFGSGAKHAINVLLRAGIKFWIYCGRTRLHFFTVEEFIDDGLSGKTVEKVCCKLGGTSTKVIDCGWCLEFGAIDWNETAMALREFVSNAIDRTIRQTGGFLRAKEEAHLRVIPVDESQRRACDSYTRIYIEMTPAVQKFYGELPKRFLHFSTDPGQVDQTLLPKADRNLGDSQAPMIYRGGVFVREIREAKYRSLYDYNFTPDALSIDESRNSSEWHTRAACAKAIRGANTETIATIYKSLVAVDQTFESELDPYYLLPTYETPSDAEKERWQAGWKQAAGNAIVGDLEASHVNEFANRKGFEVKSINKPEWVRNAARFGIQTSNTVLSDNEQAGKEPLVASASALQAVDIVWDWLLRLEMTKGKTKPRVSCYRDLMDAECDTMGYYEDGTVYLREDISSAVSKHTLKVALEECVHYVTGSTDCSRDFQSFLLEGWVELLA